MNNISGAARTNKTTKMEPQAKKSQRLKLLTIVAMHSILGVLLVSALIVPQLYMTVLIEKFQFD